jgi:hypothetical protein
MKSMGSRPSPLGMASFLRCNPLAGSGLRPLYVVGRKGGGDAGVRARRNWDVGHERSGPRGGGADSRSVAAMAQSRQGSIGVTSRPVSGGCHHRWAPARSQKIGVINIDQSDLETRQTSTCSYI